MPLYIQELIANYRKHGTYKTAPANFIECFLKLIDENGDSGDEGNVLGSPYSSKVRFNLLWEELSNSVNPTVSILGLDVKRTWSKVLDHQF